MRRSRRFFLGIQLLESMYRGPLARWGRSRWKRGTGECGRTRDGLCVRSRMRAGRECGIGTPGGDACACSPVPPRGFTAHLTRTEVRSQTPTWVSPLPSPLFPAPAPARGTPADYPTRRNARAGPPLRWIADASASRGGGWGRRAEGEGRGALWECLGSWRKGRAPEGDLTRRQRDVSRTAHTTRPPEPRRCPNPPVHKGTSTSSICALFRRGTQ